MSDDSSPQAWSHIGRWTPAEGKRAVQAWLESGQTQSAWCAAVGLAKHRLSYWHCRLRSHDSETESTEFVSVVQQKESEIEVKLIDGSVSIMVAADFDGALLRSVVEALK